MVTKTINSMVRESLLEEGLTLHSYVGFLLHGIAELQRLSLHHGYSAKQSLLTINSYNRVSIPSDAGMIIDISIKDGERLLPAVRDTSLNLMYNTDDLGNKIPFPSSGDGIDDLVISEFIDDYYRDHSRFGFGGFYGLTAPQDKTFNIDYENSEIVFSNGFDHETIVLTYAVDASSSGTASTLVRMEFVDTIKSFMKWKYLENNKRSTNYQIEAAREQYVNRKRNMKALVYPVSKADMAFQIRKGIHGSTKN